MTELVIPPGPAGMQLVVHDVVKGNTTRLSVLEELFLELFPQYAHYLPRIRSVALGDCPGEGGCIHHQWLAEVNGNPAGFIIFKYLPNRNCGIGLDLAVRKQYRTVEFGKYDRFAALLIGLSMQQLELDARAWHRPVPIGLVVEVETPKSTHDPALQAQRNMLLDRYSRYGYQSLPISYYEPPYILKAGDPLPPPENFHHMDFGVFPIAGSPFDPCDPVNLPDMVYAFLVDHYCFPEDHWVVLKALGVTYELPSIVNLHVRE